MHWNYGLTEDFKSIKKTIGILNAIDLRLKQGKFYCAAKAKRAADGRRMKTEFVYFKWSFLKFGECYGLVILFSSVDFGSDSLG